MTLLDFFATSLGVGTTPQTLVENAVYVVDLKEVAELFTVCGSTPLKDLKAHGSSPPLLCSCFPDQI